jgi:tight adherence protein C
MTAADSILIGALLLAGSLLLIHLLDKGILSGMVPRLGSKIVALHEQATKMLIDRRILCFPGVHLVPSRNGWFAGELIFFATGALIISWNPSPMNAFLAIFLGAFLEERHSIIVSKSAQEADRVDSFDVTDSLLPVVPDAGSRYGSSASMQEVVRALPRGPLSSNWTKSPVPACWDLPRGSHREITQPRPWTITGRFSILSSRERLGIALSQGLRELSSRMLESQGHRAETLAQRAAVKLLFPLVIFIFPSVFLIILSPVILNLWELLGE